MSETQVLLDGIEMEEQLSYGEFGPWCRHVPSLALCNVFFRRLLADGHIELLGLPLTANVTSSPNFNATAVNNTLPVRSPEVQSVILAAGVGVNTTCAIPRAGYNGSHGNWPLAMVGALAFCYMIIMWRRINRRVAAVGRSEFLIFVGTFAATIPFNVFASASFLEQASAWLLICTALQAGLLSSLYGSLLQCAVVETQVVEDGTIGSLLPTWIFWFINFASTAFTHLDTAYGWTNTLGYGKPMPRTLKNNSLFTSDFLIPLILVVIITLLKIYVSVGMLGERKPLLFNLLAGACWGASQVMTFVVSAHICKGTGARFDGASLALALQTASVWAMYRAWVLSTEADFVDDEVPPKSQDVDEKTLAGDEEKAEMDHERKSIDQEQQQQLPYLSHHANDKDEWFASTYTLQPPAPVLTYSPKYKHAV